MHFIIEQLKHNQFLKCFIFLHRLIESSPPYFKKNPVRSTPVSFDRRDRRTPAKLPRSNKATGRVTKGQAAQPTYAGLANEVVSLNIYMQLCPYIYSPENE